MSTEYDAYIIEAQKLDMDVNDYCESVLGWGNKKEDVMDNVCIYSKKEHTTILEIGSGTGGYSRYLLECANKVIMTDCNGGFVHFLKDYSRDATAVQIYKNDGVKLPFAPKGTIDIVFAGGFAYLKLYNLASYFVEAARVLKDGGMFVFNYYDISNEIAANKFLQSVRKWQSPYATVFNLNTLVEVASCCGFKLHSSKVSLRERDLVNRFVCFRLAP